MTRDKNKNIIHVYAFFVVFNTINRRPKNGSITDSKYHMQYSIGIRRKFGGLSKTIPCYC